MTLFNILITYKNIWTWVFQEVCSLSQSSANGTLSGNCTPAHSCFMPMCCKTTGKAPRSSPPAKNSTVSPTLYSPPKTQTPSRSSCSNTQKRMPSSSCSPCPNSGAPRTSSIPASGCPFPNIFLGWLKLCRFCLPVLSTSSECWSKIIPAIQRLQQICPTDPFDKFRK